MRTSFATVYVCISNPPVNGKQHMYLSAAGDTVCNSANMQTYTFEKFAGKCSIFVVCRLHWKRCFSLSCKGTHVCKRHKFIFIVYNIVYFMILYTVLLKQQRTRTHKKYAKFWKEVFRIDLTFCTWIINFLHDDILHRCINAYLLHEC